jgi:HEAT repeat protein
MDLERVDPEPSVRAALIASAVTCDPRHGTAWTTETFGDPSPGVRAAAVFAVAHNGLPWTPETLRVLEDSLSDGDPFSDLSWVWTLDGLTSTILSLGPEVGWEVLEHLLASSRPAVRVVSIGTVQRVLWETPDGEPRARAALHPLLSDHDPEVREKADQLIELLDINADL